MNACVEIQAAANYVSLTPKDHEPSRRSANYAPSVWGEHFLAYTSSNFQEEMEEQEYGRLKEEVRKKLLMIVNETTGESRRMLELIDAIQRLGVAYHFEREIEALVPSMLEQFEKDDDAGGDDLYVVALRFRLLRQLGHYVPCDVFGKFKDSEEKFKESLGSHVLGLLSLFEAANYRVHDEYILEEALNFTISKLQSMLPNLDDILGPRVKQALEMPIQKTLTRLGARQFVRLYQEDRSHDAVVLNFAKLDFNFLQRLHQNELSKITKWWKGVDCPNKFPFARDKLVECYFWILGVYFEPKYTSARTTATKIIAMASVLDDIYDVHGTLDELTLFTDSIQRWHISALDQLPSYMRHYYESILSIYSEMEEMLAKSGKSNLVNYAISSFKDLARAYFEEAQWRVGGFPSVEEYMAVALRSSGYPMVATNCVVCMGEFVTEDSLNWVAKNPLILRASSVIARLMDDIVTYQVEKERGEVVSAVECHMRQYGTSIEEAIGKFEKQVRNAWKDTNKECLIDPNSSVVPMCVLERILNLSRVIHFLYKDGDGYTNSSANIKDLIKSVLVDPIQI